MPVGTEHMICGYFHTIWARAYDLCSFPWQMGKNVPSVASFMVHSWDRAYGQGLHLKVRGVGGGGGATEEFKWITLKSITIFFSCNEQLLEFFFLR